WLPLRARLREHVRLRKLEWPALLLPEKPHVNSRRLRRLHHSFLRNRGLADVRLLPRFGTAPHPLLGGAPPDNPPPTSKRALRLRPIPSQPAARKAPAQSN